MNDKNSPFQSKVLEHRILTSSDAIKTTYHIALALDLSQNPNSYNPGDALGIIPHNCIELVDQLCTILKVNSNDCISSKSGASLSVREALCHSLDLQKIPLGLWKLLQEKCQDSQERECLAYFQKNKVEKQESFKDILDVLLAFPKTFICIEELFPLMTSLKPRLYSISSSLSMYPHQVHILITAVETTHNERKRLGVSSSNTCLSLKKGDKLTVFFSENKHFKLPTTPNTPIIMVGPGTGLAPFRSFLQERKFQKESENWLFFGSNSQKNSYLFQDELETWSSEGFLKLSVVFSEKKQYPYYVQHAMEQTSKELWNWINQKKSYLYICGDAEFMAKDVQKTLEKIIMEQGFMSLKEAQIYLKLMKKDKRFLLDIY